jgi:outer membrane immunogenic protein
MISAFSRGGAVMKKIIAAAAVAACASASVVSAASAADMPAKAPMMAAPAAGPNWTGFYAGIQGGANWSNFSVEEHAAFSTITAAATNSTKNASGEVGIYGGYNYQFSQGFVLGGEADFNWTHLSGTTPAFSLTSSSVCGAGGVSTQMCVGPVTNNVRWYGTVRGTLAAAAVRHGWPCLRRS